MTIPFDKNKNLSSKGFCFYIAFNVVLESFLVFFLKNIFVKSCVFCGDIYNFVFKCRTVK